MVRFLYVFSFNFIIEATKLKVIPVIDILNGIVVHAERGKRREYQPLQTSLTQSVEPVEVAKAFKKLGFKDLYIADLDAIIDCSIDFQVLKRITDETGLELMVDAGVTEHGEGAKTVG